MVTVRHPEVFGTSISFSGYFYAGTANPNSARPFGTSAALAAHSPTPMLANIASSLRPSMYFVVIVNPNQTFYGPEAALFEKALQTGGYPFIVVPSAYTHGWPQVRYEFPTAMADWAARLVIDRVF
jgi:S-formylglutathione hydrolase FrmB